MHISKGGTARWLAVAAAGAAGLVALATPAMGADAATSGLPPPDQAAIARLFDAQLRRLGLHVSRASLQRPPRYTPDPRGQHLAVYATPTGTSSSADYQRNITAVAQVFLPLVFNRWPRLQSFDVCQEPLPSVDPRPEAPPITQLFVTRRGAARIHWARVSVTGLLAATRAAARHSHPDVTLYVDTPLLHAPVYQPRGAAAP